MLQIPFFWQALIFSSIAIGAVAGSAWWLYLSPVHARAGGAGEARPPAPGFILGLAAILLLSGLQLVLGGFWDASMHILTGEVPGGADFLWPPHIMIYSSFFFILIAAGVALRAIALPASRAGIDDPRLWVRRNPYLGAVALCALYGILSIPGDALWHLLFGIDLTAWSPPHVFLGIAAALPLFAAAGMVSRFRPLGDRPLVPALLTAALLAVGLNVIYLIGVIEFELPGNGPLKSSMPQWIYPTVAGCIVFFVSILAARLVQHRWAATLTAVFFYGVRILVLVAMATTDQVVPFLPVGFLLGAFLIDWLPWDRIPSFVLRTVAIALAFAVGYEIMAVPILLSRPDIFLSSADLIKTLITLVLVGLLLLPAARWFGELLLTEAPEPKPALAAAGDD
jgi:hypothetical protein